MGEEITVAIFFRLKTKIFIHFHIYNTTGVPMKSLRKSILAVAVILTTMLAGCLTQEHPYTPSPKTAGDVLSTVNKNTTDVSIEINPNLELFSVVYILAFNGSDPFIVAPQSYVQDVLTYFAPYKNHKAVEYIRGILNESYPYYYRDNIIMELSGRLIALDYLPNETNLGDLKPLADFANESNFMKFYKDHEEEYQKVIEHVIKTGVFRNLPEKYKVFFGYSFAGYRVEYSYSLRIHGYSTVRGGIAYYVSSVPQPTKMLPSYEVQDQFEAIAIIHEFTHPFVGKILRSQNLGNMTYYLERVRKELPILVLSGDWHVQNINNYLNELLTEGFAEYLALHSNISPSVVKFRLFKLSILLYPLSDVIKEYEHFEDVKKDNETFEGYLPTLLLRMQKWATPENITRYYNMVAPINGYRALNKIASQARVIIVYGTKNPDNTGTEYDRNSALALRGYLKEIFKRNGINVDVLVKSDNSLTKEELKENLILIGGPVANEVTRKINSRLPVTFINEKGWKLKRNPSIVENFVTFSLDNNLTEILSNSTISCDKIGGVTQVIRNPWNREKFITVIAGLTRYGTREMTSYFGYSSSYVLYCDETYEEGFYTQSGDDI
ncbi:DUF4932 domain-containing protein [Thermococcus sp.]